MKNTSLLAGLCLLLFSCGTSQQRQEEGASVYEFKETYRPQFHFTPPSMWMNDPNGMVYHQGEYHLFYQHNPDSTVWGPMHWGHAVSTDLVHWEHLPIALFPDNLGTIFSGSAVVDYNNTSGLGTADNPPMIAIFTYHSAEKAEEGRNDFQTQGIAFSLDNGRNWTKYEGNPVLPNPGIRDFRDPKVMWYEEGQKWVMSLAVADHISFYSSPDLKEWTFESDFGKDIGAHGGVWECPDLFKLPVEGTGEEKWVLLVSINPGGPNGGSATQYFVGDFDGKKFTVDEQFKQELTAEAVIPDGKMFADFEGRTYSSWKTEGDAFGKGPAKGTFQDQMKVSNFSGSGLVNSFRNGDAGTGKLTSPAFIVASDYINFLIGGGKHPEGAAVNLVVDGQVKRTATGNNSESLSWKSWSTKELKGKGARIEITDRETGGWGHILVDDILFSDEPAINKEEGIWIDYGRDNYAGVTWSGIPEEDGRRIFMGWMSNWDYANVVPTESWRSAMTFARRLELKDTGEGLRVTSVPVRELRKIYGSRHNLESRTITDNLNISEMVPFPLSTFDLQMELEASAPDAAFALELSNSQGQKITIGFDPETKAYYIDRTKAGLNNFSNNFSGIHYGPRITEEPVHSLRLLVDVASVELFADGGKTVMTDIFFPDEVFNSLNLIPRGSAVKLNSGEMRQVQSIWDRKVIK